MKTEESRSITDDTRINPEDLNGNMIDLPSIYIYWCSQINELKRMYQEAEMHYDIWHANKKKLVNENFYAKGGGKKDLTETAKNETVLTDHTDEYIKERSNLILLENKIDQLKSGIKALELKGDMLISAASLHRTGLELTGGMTVKETGMSGRVRG